MKLGSLSLAIVLSFFLSTAASAGMKWIDANNDSCDKACSSQHMQAVKSGTFTNGNPYYVCSGNVKNDGFRPGFNLSPSWSSACWVGWGTKEIPVTPYKCLCECVCD
jgi:hypothetical protein